MLKSQVQAQANKAPSDAAGQGPHADSAEPRNPGAANETGPLPAPSAAGVGAADPPRADALTRAAFFGNQQAVDELIALQVDVNATDALGCSALALAGSHIGIVRSLLDAKADPALEANKNTVLNAVRWGKSEVAQMLLQAGATPNATDLCGNAALTHAVERQDAGLVQALIAAKADPNHGANQHALVSAAASPNPALLQVLLDAGARPDARFDAGMNALFNAFLLERTEAVKQWFPANSLTFPPVHQDPVPVRSPLPIAVFVGSVPVANILRDAGCSLAFVDLHGYDLLMAASARGQVQMVESLLQPRNGAPGADPNFQALCDRKTALMFAAGNGHPAVVKILLAAGADPIRVDSLGWSALGHAMRCVDAQQKYAVQTMLVLACSGKSPDAGDEIGETRQFAASSQGSMHSSWDNTSQSMDDIGTNPALIELVGCETAFQLPHHPL